MINRRSLISGLVSLITAPAIVRAGSLMRVNVTLQPIKLSYAKIYYEFIDGIHPSAEAGRRILTRIIDLRDDGAVVLPTLSSENQSIIYYGMEYASGEFQFSTIDR